ncbi:hypothetical protein ACSLBF_13830 [Pseudoalteromonas sp. T1lg65]|uniref:hypothetical protein n=1 Tax=Pseudoalteromonas sp. T1lg65 TaxID=2077101 RepID=UPI003F7AE01B
MLACSVLSKFNQLIKAVALLFKDYIINEVHSEIAGKKMKVTTIIRAVIATLLLLSIIFAISFLLSLDNSQPRQSAAENAISHVDKTPPLSGATSDERIIQPSVIPKMQSSCKAYVRALKSSRRLQANFVSTKAISWYFEGVDKYKIAHTLAANFDYQTAMQWLEKINGLSKYHAQTPAQVSQIEQLSFGTQAPLTLHSMLKLIESELGPNGENLNLLVNSYPDIEYQIRLSALSQALQNVDFQRSFSAIQQLKPFADNPLFFVHPIKHEPGVFILSQFPKPQAKQLLAAMFDLAPVYLDPRNPGSSLTLQALVAIDNDKSNWRTKNISPKMFISDPEVQHRLNELSQHYSDLTPPRVEDYCTSEIHDSDITLKKVHANEVNKTLSPAWQAIKNHECPSTHFMTHAMSLATALNSQGISLDALSSYNDIINQNRELNRVLSTLSHSEKGTFANLIYANQKYTEQQVENLINANLAPLDSDFYLLIFKLPIEQQKRLLSKQMFKLKNSNWYGASLITQVLTKGTDSNVIDELIPFLLSQGASLVGSESDIDPLWFAINNLTAAHSELPVNALSSIIENTQLNEVHIDAMYKLKQRNMSLYNQLIEQFPSLHFDKPKMLIDITCQNQ